MELVVRVRCFSRQLVSFRGVIMGQGGVTVRLGGMLMRFLVVALAVVLGCQVVMLRCFLVVMRRLVVCFVDMGLSCGKSPGANPTRRFVKSSLAVAEDSRKTPEINTKR